MTSLLGNPVCVQLVSVCDGITYKALLDVLIPSVLHPVPESLADAMRKFSCDLEGWLESALQDLPEDLHVAKFRGRIMQVKNQEILGLLVTEFLFTVRK